MAKDRLSLEVQAQPVNTYTAPVAAAAQLYDEASVRYALQLSDAFRDFSQTAASLAASLKRDQNEEDIQAGIQTVRENQMSFADLVKQGKIKPSENPWIAIGAQQASGALEGTKARAELHGLMEQQSVNNPKFYDSPESFEALVSSYAANKAGEMAQTPFESKAFFESLDPYVASLRLQHEDKMIETRKQKVVLGVGAAVANGIDDFISPEENIRNLSVSVLQEKIDEMGRIGGLSQTEINRLVVDNFVGLMAQGEQSEKAQQLFEQLDSAPGMKLSKTEYAVAQMAAARGKIEANRNRLTLEESKMFSDEFMGTDGVVDQVVGGKLTLEEAQQRFDDFTNGPSRRMSITGAEYEQKRNAIGIEVTRRKAAAERQREEDNQNLMLEMATNGSSMLPAGMSEDEAYSALTDRMENTMDSMGFKEAQKIQIRTYLGQVWAKNEKARAEQRLNESQQVLWNGTANVQGLVSELNAAATAYVDVDNILRGAASANIPNPRIDTMKAKIDSFIESIGERPDSNTEVVKSVYKNAVTRMDAVVQQQEDLAKSVPAFRGTLAPLPDDPFDIRQQKAQIRGRMSALRLNIGMQFKDYKESTRITLAFLENITPELENNVPYQLEDALSSFLIARQNNIPIDMIIGPSVNSETGKRLIGMLDWAANAYANTQAEPAEILKDMARVAGFSKAADTDFFGLRKNPLNATDMNTTGVQAVEFADAYQNAIESLGVTNPDANLYPLTVWRNAYMNSLQATRNHRQALVDAEEAINTNTMSIRGSVIPANMVARTPGVRSTTLDESYLSFWLDQNFPGKEATLVVVSMNPDGSPLLAVRDKNGNSIRGAKGLYTPNDFAMKPEYIRNYNPGRKASGRSSSANEVFQPPFSPKSIPESPFAID